VSEAKIIKTGVFLEVNGFVEIRDAWFADDLEKHFYKL